MSVPQRRAQINPRTPCVNQHMLVDEWSARLDLCAALRQWTAFLSACLSSSRAQLLRNAHCVSKRVVQQSRARAAQKR
eukprot:10092723-Lingulodinium_polyedra.AAC.1